MVNVYAARSYFKRLMLKHADAGDADPDSAETVTQRLVRMRMGVQLFAIPGKIMFVLMMLIVTMVARQRLMLVSWRSLTCSHTPIIYAPAREGCTRVLAEKRATPIACRMSLAY